MVRKDKKSTVADPMTVAFLNACSSGDFDVVKKYTSSPTFNVDNDVNGVTGLMKAAAAGEIAIIKHLVSSGAVNGWTGPMDDPHNAFCWAAENGQIEVLKYFETESGMGMHELLTTFQGKDKKKTALDYALQSISLQDDETTTSRKYEVLEYMIGKGGVWGEGAVDKDSIISAAARGDCRYITYCISANQSIVKMFAGKERYTLLHLAATGDHVETAKVLLANGANKNAKDKDGRTALHVAAGLGSISMVSFLVKSKCDIWTTDGIGSTPLHAAAESGHLDAARVLLGSILENVDQNIMSIKDILEKEDNNGFTPISLAFKGTNVHVSIIRYFIQMLNLSESQSSGMELMRGSIDEQQLENQSSSSDQLQLDLEISASVEVAQNRTDRFLESCYPYVWGYSMSNVNVISRQDFLSPRKFLTFSEASSSKFLVPLCDMRKDATVLYISCSVENSSAETLRDMYSMVEQFLLVTGRPSTAEILPNSNSSISSSQNSHRKSANHIRQSSNSSNPVVDYVWVGYTCIPSDEDILENHKKLEQLASKDQHKSLSHMDWASKIMNRSIIEGTKMIALLRSTLFLSLPGLQNCSQSPISNFPNLHKAMNAENKEVSNELVIEKADFIVPNFLKYFENVEVQLDCTLAAMCGLDIYLGIKWASKSSFRQVHVKNPEQSGFRNAAIDAVQYILPDVQDPQTGLWQRVKNVFTASKSDQLDLVLILKEALGSLYGENRDEHPILGINMEFVLTMIQLISSMINDGTLFDFLILDTKVFDFGLLDHLSPVSLSLFKVCILALGQKRSESEKQHLILSYATLFVFLMGYFGREHDPALSAVPPIQVELKSLHLQVLSLEARYQQQRDQYNEERYALETSLHAAVLEGKGTDKRNSLYTNHNAPEPSNSQYTAKVSTGCNCIVS